MKEAAKEFTKMAAVPIVLLLVFITFAIFYKLLGLPDADELPIIAENYYANYGYWVMFFGAIAEGMLFINWYLPGATVIIFGVAIAKEAHLNIAAAVAFVTAGFFLTSALNYAIGRYGWYRLFLKLGLKAPLERMRTKMQTVGLQSLFLAYVHPNIASLAATSAGILQLSFKKFLLYSLIALVVWNAFWATVVYFTGPAIIKLLGGWVIVAILLLWIIFVATRLMRKRKLLSSTYTKI